MDTVLEVTAGAPPIGVPADQFFQLPVGRFGVTPILAQPSPTQEPAAGNPNAGIPNKTECEPGDLTCTPPPPPPPPIPPTRPKVASTTATGLADSESRRRVCASYLQHRDPPPAALYQLRFRNGLASGTLQPAGATAYDFLNWVAGAAPATGVLTVPATAGDGAERDQPKRVSRATGLLQAGSTPGLRAASGSARLRAIGTVLMSTLTATRGRASRVIHAGLAAALLLAGVTIVATGRRNWCLLGEVPEPAARGIGLVMLLGAVGLVVPRWARLTNVLLLGMIMFVLALAKSLWSADSCWQAGVVAVLLLLAAVAREDTKT